MMHLFPNVRMIQFNDKKHANMTHTTPLSLSFCLSPSNQNTILLNNEG